MSDNDCVLCNGTTRIHQPGCKISVSETLKRKPQRYLCEICDGSGSRFGGWCEECLGTGIQYHPPSEVTRNENVK